MSYTLRYLLCTFLFYMSLVVVVAQQEAIPSQSKAKSSVTAQPGQNAYHMNPYESLGIKAKVLTATDGEYPEFFPNDTIVKIGSILYNTVSNQIVAFARTDTIYLETTNEPQLISRFISPDPHAFKYWSLSPYNYVANNPLRNIDPDGRDIIGVNKESAQKARDDIHLKFGFK